MQQLSFYVHLQLFILSMEIFGLGETVNDPCEKLFFGLFDF